MARPKIPRSIIGILVGAGPRLARSFARVAAGALLVIVVPQAASAQFGALKKLKNAVSPDSAAKVAAATQDSIALAAKLAAGDTTPLQRSRFSRAVTAAGAASQKFEQVTGVSAKDAALAATGLGATNLIAKKFGVDPMALATKGMNLSQKRAHARAGGVGGMPTIPGMPDLASLMNAKNALSAQGIVAPNALGTKAVKGAQAAMAAQAAGGNAMAALTTADMLAMATFQEEMMKVVNAATAGDVAAQARLVAWETIAVKHNAEIETLAMAASGGDVAAIQKLQVIQVNIMKEWAGVATVPPASPTKATTPKKASKP